MFTRVVQMLDKQDQKLVRNFARTSIMILVTPSYVCMPSQLQMKTIVSMFFLLLGPTTI